MATDDRWIYPLCWCVTCKAGFATVEDLIDHQLTKRHWRPPPGANRGDHSTSIPPPDRAGAALLRQALARAEARRQGEQADIGHVPKSPQEDGDGDPPL